MLIRLTVSNFLSFRDETEFSMLATREKQHGDRVHVGLNGDLKVLPIAGIYGANGSGKSNFYRTIEFLRDLVLNPAQAPEDPIPVRPFRLDALKEGEPSRFSLDLLADSTVYRLTIAVTSEAILEERLELIGSKISTIYTRGASLPWQFPQLTGSDSPSELRAFIAFKARDTLPNQLFLSVLRGRGVPHIDTVISWFREGLQLMTPNTVFKQLEMSLQAVDGLRRYCIDALRSADTGISDLERHEVPLSALPFPVSEKLSLDIEQTFRKIIPEGKVMLMSGPDGQRFTLRHEKDGLHASRLVTVHQTRDGRKVEFYMSDESDGTQRFVDLLPAFYELADKDKPKVFIIDEIDRSLHTDLTWHLLNIFLQTLSSLSRSQLIFTTHNVLLMDQDLLRRDEIWFTEKDDDGNSRLIALSDFKGVRADKDIRKSYLLGRYGGMPRISGLPRRGQEALAFAEDK